MSLSAEHRRLSHAIREIPSVAQRYQPIVAAVVKRLSDRQQHNEQTFGACGRDLWLHAIEDHQQGNLDDRPLYWARVAIESAIQDTPRHLRTAFDHASRNQLATESLSPSNLLVLTAFDPFALDQTIQQGNPSGSFALKLHGTTLDGLDVLAMIFPVRYKDFDAGCVERALTLVFRNPRVKAVLTASMGRTDFDLERFPARCRGSTQPDNTGRIARPFEELERLPKKAPSFVEFTLPVSDTTAEDFQQVGRTVNDNRIVKTLQNGEFPANNLTDLLDQQPLAGSGGNFLSNEVSYRSLLLRQQLNCSIPVGHIHVPRMQGFDGSQLTDNLNAFKRLIKAILKRI